MEYSLEELQRLYGRELDEISRSARPISLEGIRGRWRDIVEEAIRFIREEYYKDYLPLTIRQVHYHLVHQPVGYLNDKRHSSKLTRYILRARIAGLIDWEMISEEESIAYEYSPVGGSPENAIREALRTAKYSAGKNPWNEMGKYVLIISEKRELGPQLESIARKYYVRLVCTRGYGIWSRMYQESLKIKRALDEGREVYVLFVTDHDPSGLDINRFGASILKNWWKMDVIAVRAMLTLSQVKQYSLPPAPTKVKDPRAKWYIQKFGDTSWEVDALGKDLMRDVLSAEIERLIDRKIWDQVMKENEENYRKTEELSRQFLSKIGGAGGSSA
jgi:hypothetical protein